MWALLSIFAAARAAASSAADSEFVGPERPPAIAPKPFATANFFAYGGRVAFGPGLGLGVSSDVGVSWVLHLHAEAGIGITHLPEEEPSGTIGVVRANVEVAYPIANAHGVIGPAAAVDVRLPTDGGCYDPTGECTLPVGGAALGVAFLDHRGESRYLSGFIGAEFFLVYDVGALAPRMRLEWGRRRALYYAFEASGPFDLTAMVGVHL